MQVKNRGGILEHSWSEQWLRVGEHEEVGDRKSFNRCGAQDARKGRRASKLGEEK